MILYKIKMLNESRAKLTNIVMASMITPDIVLIFPLSLAGSDWGA